MTLEMRQPISDNREHQTDPMIPDVSTATGTNSMSAKSREYFRLVKYSAALDWQSAMK